MTVRQQARALPASPPPPSPPVLWEEGPCTVGHLGDRLHLDSGTLSPLLKRLESAGLVRRRRRNATDERRVDITLTSRGRALEERAACIPDRLLGPNGPAAADLAALREALRLITAELYARGTT